MVCMWVAVFPWQQVLSVDDDKGKLTLTLRPSDLKVPDLASKGAVDAILSSFRAYISERDSVLEEMRLAQANLPPLAEAFVPGGRVTGHVTSLMGDGAVVGLEGGVRGKIVRASMHG